MLTKKSGVYYNSSHNLRKDEPQKNQSVCYFNETPQESEDEKNAETAFIESNYKYVQG